MQFEAVRSEAGLNRFVMTPTKWIEQTNAVDNDISKIRGVWIKLRKLKEEYCCSLKNNMLQ